MAGRRRAEPHRPSPTGRAPRAHLLPAFDEYTVAYTDRRPILDPADAGRAVARDGILNPSLVVEGHAVGTWKRTLGKCEVVIAPSPFRPLSAGDQRVVSRAAKRYGAFLGANVEVRW